MDGFEAAMQGMRLCEQMFAPKSIRTYSQGIMWWIRKAPSLSRSMSVTLPPRTAALTVSRHFRTRRAFSCQSSHDTGPTEPHHQNTRGCMSCSMIFCKPLLAIIAVTAKIARKAYTTMSFARSKHNPGTINTSKSPGCANTRS